MIPRDCVAHIHEGLADAALQMMETNMRAHVVTGEEALEVAREPYQSQTAWGGAGRLCPSGADGLGAQRAAARHRKPIEGQEHR